MHDGEESQTHTLIKMECMLGVNNIHPLNNILKFSSANKCFSTLNLTFLVGLNESILNVVKILYSRYSVIKCFGKYQHILLNS